MANAMTQSCNDAEGDDHDDDDGDDDNGDTLSQIMKKYMPAVRFSAFVQCDGFWSGFIHFIQLASTVKLA